MQRRSHKRAAKRGVLTSCFGVAALLAGSLAASSLAQAGPSRWPLWPNEVTQTAEALRSGSDATEAARAAAMRRLANYPDALVVDLILLGLADESYEVRREAMRACVDRNLRACLPAAQEAWMNTDDTALRVRALDMFAAHPDEGRTQLLVDALLDDDPTMRQRAATALSRTRLDAESDARVRTLLQSKLDDVIAATRRRAAVALGLRGPGAGSVALIRRLEDPDPAVREAAAEALGRLGDASAVAPLLRTLGREPDRALARTGIAALARLPGEAVDEALLRFFDRPLHARRTPVVEAIGLRAHPSEQLIDGMVRRLRDANVHSDALRALRLLGPAAVPAIEAALGRGVEASLQDELERLLAAHKKARAETQARARADAPSDRGSDGGGKASRKDPPLDAASPQATRRALRDAVDRPGLAMELGRAAPQWLAGAVSRAFERHALPGDARDWLWALTLAPASAATWSSREGTRVVTRLAAWAQEPQHSSWDSCLAAQALGSQALLADSQRGELVRKELLRLAQSPRASARACAANGLARAAQYHTLEALLADPSPAVRARASLAMLDAGAGKVPVSLLARLAYVAVRDPHVGPRSCAAWVVAQRADKGEADKAHRAAVRSSVWRSASRTRTRTGTSEAWMEFEVNGRTVIAPVTGAKEHKWVVVPSDHPADTADRRVLQQEIRPNDARGFSF